MKRMRYNESMCAMMVKQLVMPAVKKQSIVTISGPLGAGKTSLVKELARQLGVEGSVTSPTYAYMTKYLTADKTPLYHFDLYRLESCEDFEVYGFASLLEEEEAIVVIEWPEVIEPLLAASALASRVKRFVCEYDDSDMDARVARML